MNDDTVTCVSCGNPMPRSTRFCPECGQANAAATAPAESTTVTSEPTSGFLTPEMSVASSALEPDPAPDTGSPTLNIGESAARVDQADTGPQDMSASAPTPFSGPASEVAASAATGAASYSPYASQDPTPPQGQPTQYIAPTQGGYTPPAQAGYAPPSQPYAQPANPAATQNLGVYPGAQPPAPTQGSQYSQYPQYSQNPINTYQYQQQVGVAGIPPKDPTVALLLELIGYLGFLGIGHMYAGRITRGVALLIGWWLYWGIVGVLFATILLSPVACIMAIAWPLVPIASGLWIRNDLVTNGPVVRSTF